MIRHIVLVQFRPQMTTKAINALFDELQSLIGKVPGLISITAGRSDSPEKMERGFRHGFIADFADWDALQTYQDHPDHQRFGARLVAASTGGKDGILVFDLLVTD